MSSPLLTAPGRRTTAVYVTFFMVMGVHLPFWPLWLRDWGLTPGEVGMFTAVGMGVRVVAGMLVPALADRLDARRYTVAACALACIVILLCHLMIESKGPLLLATLAFGAAIAGMGPIAEALGVAASRVHGFAYAQSRGMGSIGFLAANLLIGALIARLGTQVALWWMIVCLALVALLVIRHPGGRRVEGQIPPSMRQIGRLVTAPVFAIFAAAVAFLQASHAVFYAFASIHWRNLGIGESMIGGLWASAIAVEIVFMLTIGAWVTRRLGPVRALAVAGAASVLRWTLMMLDPPTWALWPLQGLHAFTFGLAHLGAMAFVVSAVPDRYGAAAQGAAGAMGVGLALAIGMAIASTVYPALGGLSYGIGVAFALVGLGFCAWLSRRWTGGEIGI